MNISILRCKQVSEKIGLSKSTIYKRIQDGLWPKGVRIGIQAVGWPAHEVDAMNVARIIGMSDDKIRLLS